MEAAVAGKVVRPEKTAMAGKAARPEKTAMAGKAILWRKRRWQARQPVRSHTYLELIKKMQAKLR